MKKLLVGSGLAAVMACMPVVVQAQQVAYTAGTTNMRAGPDAAYPLVAVVHGQAAVRVLGCLRDYTWCDVEAGGYRGWVYAPNLRYTYQNQAVPLNTIGAIVGIAALAFILDDYWENHYRDRRWYDERNRWAWRGRTPQYTYARPVPMPPAAAPRADRRGPPPHANPRWRDDDRRGPSRGRDRDRDRGRSR
jgi:uncharacterized protein YraI